MSDLDLPGMGAMKSARDVIVDAMVASMFAPHELPLSPDLQEKYRATADAVRAALIAAGYCIIRCLPPVKACTLDEQMEVASKVIDAPGGAQKAFYGSER